MIRQLLAQDDVLLSDFDGRQSPNFFYNILSKPRMIGFAYTEEDTLTLRGFMLVERINNTFSVDYLNCTDKRKPEYLLDEFAQEQLFVYLMGQMNAERYDMAEVIVSEFNLTLQLLLRSLGWVVGKNLEGKPLIEKNYYAEGVDGYRFHHCVIG